MAQYSDEMVRYIQDLNKFVMGLDGIIPSFHTRDRLCEALTCRLKQAYLRGQVDAYDQAIGVEKE